MRFDARWTFAGRSGTIRDVEVAWTERWATEGSADLRRVSVSLPIPPDVDVPGLVAGGVPLSSMRVVIQTEAGTELLSGDLRGGEYGMAGEPVEGDVGDIEREDLGTVPPFIQAGSLMGVVDEVSWPGAPADVRGAVYPWVFGSPGLVNGGTVPATPALVVDVDGYDRLLVAGHSVTATQVVIWGPAFYGSDVLFPYVATIDPMIDGRGQVVATVDASSFGQSGFPAWDPTARYWCSWAYGDALPGRLDQLATTLLGLSTLDVDGIEQASQSAPLSRYRLAGYLDSGEAPSALMQDLLGEVPATLQRSARGVYVAAAALSLEESTVTEALTVGRGVHRLTRVRYVEDQPVSRVHLEYAWNAALSRYTEAVALSRPGAGRAIDLSAGHVYDRVTAEAMATHLLSGGTRWRELDVALDEDRYGWGGPREVRVGQVVSVTDADLRLTAVRARVMSIERDRTGLRVTLRMRG